MGYYKNSSTLSFKVKNKNSGRTETLEVALKGYKPYDGTGLTTRAADEPYPNYKPQKSGIYIF